MSAAHFADVLGLLVKGHRTSKELMELTGLTKKSVYLYLEALEGEGLLEREKINPGKGAAASDRWKWLWKWKA